MPIFEPRLLESSKRVSKQDTTNRIYRVESLAPKFPYRTENANSQGSHGRMHKESKKPTSTPRTVATLTPASYTYRSKRTNQALNSSIDEKDESPMPIMFSSPFERHYEDTQSLLTEDKIVHRPSHHRSSDPRRAAIVGKRWLSVLCKQ